MIILLKIKLVDFGLLVNASLSGTVTKSLQRKILKKNGLKASCGIKGICDVVIISNDENKIKMTSELEIRHLSCFYIGYMTLTLQHPKALRTAFLYRTKLNNLKSYENLRSVCYLHSNDEEEFI